MGKEAGELQPKEEDVARSGWARELLMLGFLAASSQFLHDGKRVEQPFVHKPFEDAVAHEAGFDTEWCFEGSNEGAVAFLPHAHAPGSLAMMEANPLIKKVVIDSQKADVEMLLRINAQEVYHEGTTKEVEARFKERREDADDFVSQLGRKEFPEAMKWLATVIDKFRSNFTAGKLNDQGIAVDELYIESRLDEFFEALAKESQAPPLIDATLLARLAETRDRLKSAPHIKGDNRFMFDGVIVLWAQRKMNIRAAEDPVLFRKMRAISDRLAPKWRQGTVTQKEIHELITVQNEREDFALHCAVEDPSSKPGETRVIKFGFDHDFYKNFADMMQRNENNGFGLMQLTDRNELTFKKALKEAGLVESASIKDKR